jgi:DNA-binding ferritin-like protein
MRGLDTLINPRFTMFAVLSTRALRKRSEYMAFRANQQLREDIWDYRYKSSAGESENVLSFNPSTAKDYGTTALNLVHQAAEIFNGMEHQAREIEERAQSLCKSFAEKLQLAEKQRDASERARREVVNELNGKLQQVSRALQQAQSRIVEAEDHAIAAEFRAQSAEVQLHKANQELAAVEQAIRKRLL